VAGAREQGFELLLFTPDVELARCAASAGVDGIVID
jgi:hypothetical protein